MYNVHIQNTWLNKSNFHSQKTKREAYASHHRLNWVLPLSPSVPYCFQEVSGRLSIWPLDVEIRQPRKHPYAWGLYFFFQARWIAVQFSTLRWILGSPWTKVNPWLFYWGSVHVYSIHCYFIHNYASAINLCGTHTHSYIYVYIYIWLALS